MKNKTKTYTVQWTETVTNVATIEAKNDVDLFSNYGHHTYSDECIEKSDYNEGSFRILKVSENPLTIT